ncbi:MAG: VCBS repeat-containing protein [Cytophagales bacterium]
MNRGFKALVSIITIPILLISACETQKATEIIAEKSNTNFELLDYTQTGVDFANIIQDKPMMNVLMYQYYHNGAGVACGDFDNDGLTDLYFVGNFGKNHLYKNLGNFKFRDVTDSSNAAGGFGWSTGVCLIDINNDGLLDIYLSKSGDFAEEQRKNELLINQGNMTFLEQAAEYGLDDPGYSNQAAFFDFDLDGDLDAYVMNHALNTNSNADISSINSDKDRLYSDHLYENQNGKFVDISKKAGLNWNSIGFGLGLGVGDFNNDMYPDIYICNDYLEHDYLYQNMGDGTFREILKDAIRHTSNFSMGNDIADINNDGFLDIFVADMAAEDNYRSKTNMSGMNPEKFWSAVDRGFHYQYMINTLQLNNGNNTFSEISQLAGLDKTDWSWAPLFGDFDNDGFKDLLVTNGLRKDERNNDFVKKKKELLKDFQFISEEEKMQIIKKILDMMPSQKIPNYIYRNNGDLTFEKKIKDWSFETPSFSNGASYADLDNDGDLDLVINNIDDAAFIYRNNTVSNNYLKIRVEGPGQNRAGMGLKVVCQASNGIQYAEHYTSRGYLSTVDNLMHFGFSDIEVIEKVALYWPDGKKQILENVKTNQLLLVKYDDAKEKGQISEMIKNPIQFQDLSDDYELKHTHKESPHDDYIKQVLLPHEMSKLGPGMTVADVNNDGLEDIYICSAGGYGSVLYLQKDDNTFERQKIAAFEQNSKYEEINSVFFDADNDGDQDLYVVCGSSEFGSQSEMYQDILYLNDGNGQFAQNNQALPNINISGSCVIPYDLDQDGDLDLFVGGRQVPEKYPNPASSFILINENAQFKYLSSEKAMALKEIGMVSDAEFLDYNEDGKIDLLLVGEWMPLTFILQDEKGFNKKVEIPNSRGWWNCIEASDLNADGQMDYVLGNLGLNVKYHGSPEEPFRVYAKDFDENGLFDIVLSSTKGKDKFPVRGRQCSSEQIPEIKNRFPNYDLFAKATIEDIYTKEELETAINYNAVHFESSLLIRKGAEKFGLKKLPNYAQISAVQDIIIDDFNKDGLKDIILAGNLEEMEVETPRCDASYGLLLLQNGDAEFNYAQNYNLNMSGNVRSIQTIIIAGHRHIAVARNNDKLSLIKPQF